MGIFNATSWTGRSDVAAVLELPKPALRSAKVAHAPVNDPAGIDRAAMLKEYARLAELTGVVAPDLNIEAFKDYLRQKDWPIFSLPEVIKYMDQKAAQESKDKCGWEWRPLRRQDDLAGAITFGRRARHREGQSIEPASDFYVTPQVQRQRYESNLEPYDRTIPLHALRKVATIASEFKKTPVSFFVSDYAPAPQIEYPDPFLMAVIPNANLAIGTGRFIIDFWDEPGFGLEASLRP